MKQVITLQGVMATDASFVWVRPATEVEGLMDSANKKGTLVTVYALTLRCSGTLTDAHVKAALHHLFRLVMLLLLLLLLHTHTHTHTHTHILGELPLCFLYFNIMCEGQPLLTQWFPPPGRCPVSGRASGSAGTPCGRVR